VAKKIKTTRPELKRYRDALARYERYLPMLKLKQQQLQFTIRDIVQRRREAERLLEQSEATLRSYQSVMRDRCGVPLQQWAEPAEIKTRKKNIAGVVIPEFEDVSFPQAQYSLFGTPPWVDQLLADLRLKNRRKVAVRVLREAEALLQKELTRIVQRVNLFEKVMIPQTREAIRIIRITLGDQMTAAVGRAKIAKGKLAATMATESPGTSQPLGEVGGESR